MKRRTRPLLNKTIWGMPTGILFFLTLLWLCAFALDAARADPGADTEIQKLFKQLSIIPLPGIAPPVDIVLQDLSGRTVRISDLKGKIVFLNFWTTWCGDCKVEMPEMEQLHRALKGEAFVMLAVDLQESDATVKAFFKTYRLTFTALLDTKGRFGRRFGVRSIPTTFILDKSGGIIGKAIGPRQWGDEQARELFKRLAARSYSSSQMN